MTAQTTDSRPAVKATASGAYTARNLSVLEGLEAVRKRPGMYIGSTDTRGLMQCVCEIIDNSVDEALAGHGHRIEVLLHADGSVEVRDDARGIPVDVEPKTGLTGVEVVMTRLHAGGKFGGGSYAASGGLHGVGASVVNALSSRLDVEVDRDGKTHAMSFQRGVPGVFAGDGPDAAFTEQDGLRVVGKVVKKRTGTRIRFWLDPQVFLKEAAVQLDELHARARQTAFLVPGLTLVVRDERAGDVAEETFHYSGGISEFTDFLAPDPAVTETLRLQGVGHFNETVPVLDGKGHMSSQEVERELTVDVALRWGTGYDTTVRSFVNVVATAKGGTHVRGFERGMRETVNEQLRAQRVLRAAEDDVITDDVLEGLTAVVTVRLAEPQFEGQTKEVLGTSAASRIVHRVVSKELKALLTSTRRGDKTQAKAILEKVAGAARTRIAARQHKEHQRRKNALETSSLPAKLADCRSDDVERSELFIVEGDSALGTAKLARDSEFQALLPIRGKILNVQKASPSRPAQERRVRLDHPGHRRGQRSHVRPRVGALRQGHPDGRRRRRRRPHPHPAAHPDPPRHAAAARGRRVYAAVPPLHRIEVITGGGKKNEYVYTYSDAEMQRRLAELERKGKRVKMPPSATRASARWMPTSWPRRRWTRGNAPCGGSRRATRPRSRRSSSCSWATTSARAASSSSRVPTVWTGTASTPSGKRNFCFTPWNSLLTPSAGS